MTDLVDIFYEIDNFCKEFEAQIRIGNKKRERECSMTTAEVMTISIWYHFSGYKSFKDYYTKQESLKRDFPNLVSYSRFIELRKIIVMPTMIFLCIKKLGLCTGISYVDAFKLEACHIKRASSHKTLKSIAQKGKTSMGWFYGMKVHIIINHHGDIVAFYISSGNVADNNEIVLLSLTKKIVGKLFGDRGYLVNPKRFEALFKKGIHLVTKIRENMKNKLVDLYDKLLLSKRGVIESVGDILKNHLDMEHSRHRSIWSFFLHIFTSLLAYQFRDKKPHLSTHSSTFILTS